MIEKYLLKRVKILLDPLFDGQKIFAFSLGALSLGVVRSPKEIFAAPKEPKKFSAEPFLRKILTRPHQNGADALFFRVQVLRSCLTKI